MSNLSHVDANLLLREAYDTTFGLYSEQDAKNPMMVMTMHPHEDYVTDGSVMTLMTRVINAKLPSITGMSLLDLMEMPRELLESLIKLGNKKVDGEANAADALLEGLNE